MQLSVYSKRLEVEIKLYVNIVQVILTDGTLVEQLKSPELQVVMPSRFCAYTL
jgi:hypothetical protein